MIYWTNLSEYTIIYKLRDGSYNMVMVVLLTELYSNKKSHNLLAQLVLVILKVLSKSLVPFNHELYSR